MAVKDKDLRGTQAAKDFVEEIANLERFSIYGMPYRTLSKLQRKARRIRAKFRRKK